MRKTPYSSHNRLGFKGITFCLAGLLATACSGSNAGGATGSGQGGYAQPGTIAPLGATFQVTVPDSGSDQKAAITLVRAYGLGAGLFVAKITVRNQAPQGYTLSGGDFDSYIKAVTSDGAFASGFQDAQGCPNFVNLDIPAGKSVTGCAVIGIPNTAKVTAVEFLNASLSTGKVEKAEWKL